MQFLFKDKTYIVNSGFWTAVKYRLQYCESVYDIQSGGEYAEKLMNLLHTAIEGEKPSITDIYNEAIQKDNSVLPFCIALYSEIMKSDKVYEKYQRKDSVSASGDDFDELTVLTQFSKTNLPERVLDIASLPQIVGLMCEFSKENTTRTEYKKMNGNDIKTMYGGRKK